MWTRHLPRRTQQIVIATAVALGLWLGLTAPGVSPVAVAPPGAAPAAVTAVANNAAPAGVAAPMTEPAGQRPGRPDGRR